MYCNCTTVQKSGIRMSSHESETGFAPQRFNYPAKVPLTVKSSISERNISKCSH